MNELDRFIAEIVRIRRCVQVYIELFTEEESIDVLTNVSGEVFAITQRSMHDEILISVSRLYDGKGFQYKGEMKENLSQINLVSQHKNILTEKLKNLREETRVLFEKLDIKDYRDEIVAHNNKDTLVGNNEIVKHNIDSDSLISLLDTSLSLIIGIKAELEQKQNVNVPDMINEKYEGIGKALINKLLKI
jgi:hypothetical protein